MLACFGGRREKTKERKRDEREGARDVRVLHGDVQSAEERAEGEEVRRVADVEREGEADDDLERDHEDSQLDHERGPAPVRQAEPAKAGRRAASKAAEAGLRAALQAADAGPSDTIVQPPQKKFHLRC